MLVVDWMNANDDEDEDPISVSYWLLLRINLTEWVSKHAILYIFSNNNF